LLIFAQGIIGNPNLSCSEYMVDLLKGKPFHLGPLEIHLAHPWTTGMCTLFFFYESSLSDGMASNAKNTKKHMKFNC